MNSIHVIAEAVRAITQRAKDPNSEISKALSATIGDKIASDVPALLTPPSGLVRVSNLLPRPTTTSTSDWFANSFGTGGAGTKTIEATGGHEGRPAYVLTWTTASTATGANTGPQMEITPAAHAPVTAGLPTTVSTYLEIANTPGDVQVWVRIFFKDSANATLYSAGGDVLTIRAGAGPQRVYSPTAQAPAGTVKAFINITVWTASQMGATGSLKASAPQVSQGIGTNPYRDGNYPDARWTGAVGNSATLAVPAEYRRIVDWGDSHEHWNYGGGYALPCYVEDLMPGYEVVNAGRSGETSTGIAIRAGAIVPLVTLNGGTIPATLDAVTATVSPSTTYRPTGSWPFYGTLAGVGGTLRLNENVWTFTRDVAGTAVTVAPGTPFIVHGIPTGADAWTWHGGNNLHSFEDVKRDTEAFVAKCKADGRGYLIISLYNNADEPAGSAGYADIKRINDWRKATYGNLYLDTRRVLIDCGLSLLNITPTAADNLAISEDRIPPSLMADTVHLTPDARKFIVAPHRVQAMRRLNLVRS